MEWLYCIQKKNTSLDLNSFPPFPPVQMDFLLFLYYFPNVLHSLLSFTRPSIVDGPLNNRSKYWMRTKTNSSLYWTSLSGEKSERPERERERFALFSCCWCSFLISLSLSLLCLPARSMTQWHNHRLYIWWDAHGWDGGARAHVLSDRFRQTGSKEATRRRNDWTNRSSTYTHTLQDVIVHSGNRKRGKKTLYLKKWKTWL